MPRSPRLDHPGARHHVMNRALRREAMFRDDITCALFTDTLAEVPDRFGARIHGYALMPNHYHLLVEVPRGNLSEVMKHIGQSFTQAYNRRHAHDGPVFRGRFRNRLVDDDTYWMHLLAYLHLNPVRAHLATAPEACIWTSHNAYLDPGQAPDWLTRDEMLDLYGSPEQLQDYVRDLHLKRRSAPDGFDPERLWVPTSTERTTERPERVVRTPDQAIAEVARVTGVPVDQVLARPRGPSPNRAAWLAVWWLLRATDLSQEGVADHIGVSRSRVGQIEARFREQLRSDDELVRWQDALEHGIDTAPPARRKPAPRTPPVASSETRTPQAALDEVARATGTSVAEVLARPRGRTPNRAAWLAAWWLVRTTGLDQRGVGEVLGVSRARVSQLVSALRKLEGSDPEVQRWTEALEATLHT